MLYTKQGGDVHQEPGRGVAQAGEDSGTQTSAESLRGSFFRLLPNLLNLPGCCPGGMVRRHPAAWCVAIPSGSLPTPIHPLARS